MSQVTGNSRAMILALLRSEYTGFLSDSTIEARKNRRRLDFSFAGGTIERQE